MTHTLADIARLINAELIGDGHTVISAPGTIQDGQGGEIGFLAETQYARYAQNTSLSALITHERLDTPAAQLIVGDVKAAWRQVAALFSAAATKPGIDPAALIAADARIGADVAIAAGAIIGAGATIGARCRIDAGVIIEPGVVLGADSHIAAGAQLLAGTRIGARAFIDAGAVLGSRGFGYALENGVWQSIPQLGGVVLGDDVDVGANTTIDRGAIRDTVLEDGVKLDNLIQVGHNVHIGAHTIIAGNCVIAGSVTFGRHCVVGGASVFAGHITICDGAQFTGHSSVSKSISKPGVYCSALTVMPHRQWARFVGKLKLFGKEQ